MNINNIPKGHFKLKNGKYVYITHSGYGHYPKEKGNSLMEEIINQKPKYVLVEEHPKDGLDAPDCLIDRAILSPKSKRGDVDWAIIAARKSNSKIILFDTPQKIFNKNICNTYTKYSNRLSLIHYVAYQILNLLWHVKNKNEKITWTKIIYNAKINILNYGPEEIKKSIKKHSINTIFDEWLRLVDFTKNEIASLPPNYLSALIYFIFLLSHSRERDKYMIKIIEECAKKGETVVVVGSGHITTWLQKGWIKKDGLPPSEL